MDGDLPRGLSRVSKFISKVQRYNYVVFVLVLLCLCQVGMCFRYYQRDKVSGKIRPDLPGVELSDYRFGLGDPYVMFYERDNYRGAIHFQVLGKGCRNLPETRQNWASSVDVQKRCISVCDELDCKGNCSRIHAHPEDPNNKGASKLSFYNMNDKIRSVKFCYS